jgi:hypothetical protein
LDQASASVVEDPHSVMLVRTDDVNGVHSSSFTESRVVFTAHNTLNATSVVIAAIFKG